MKANSTCALCGESNQLVDSHLIPGFVYRRLQQTESNRQDPILVTNGSAVQTSKQVTKKLLCRKCEERFSHREDNVARLTRFENGSPVIFRDVIRCDTPERVLAKLSDNIDTGQLAYFAISILWRSCVMGQGCQLGPYESEFRRYLLEESPFPSFAALGMGLLEPSALTQRPDLWITLPQSVRVGSVWLHGFMVCGLIFRCFIGKALNAKMQEISIGGRNTGGYVSINRADKYQDFLAAIDVLTGARPKGKLAKQIIS